MKSTGTYVFCLVAGSRRPSLARVPRGPAGTGPVRLLEVDRGRWLAVADAPLARYGEAAIKRGLAHLEWVSRVAVAHEAVVEAFVRAPAVLPMKLLTIFRSDARALAHIRKGRPRIEAVLTRVRDRHEWGVRVLHRREAVPPRAAGAARRTTGTGYLERRKAARDQAAGQGVRGRAAVDALYDQLARVSSAAARRSTGGLPESGGSLMLDAAFLVRRSGSHRFRDEVRRRTRTLAVRGYDVRLSGPWPPYSFLGEE